MLTIFIGLLYAVCISLITVIPNYQHQIAREFSLLLNEPVDFSQIKFNWRGLRIYAKIYNVDIGAHGAKVHIDKIKKVQLLFHPIKSLLRLKPVIDSVTIDGGNIYLDYSQKSADTNITISDTSSNELLQKVRGNLSAIFNNPYLRWISINNVNLNNTNIFVHYNSKNPIKNSDNHSTSNHQEYILTHLSFINAHKYNYIHGMIYKINKEFTASKERELLEVAIKIRKQKNKGHNKFYLGTNSTAIENILNQYINIKNSRVTKVLLSSKTQLKIWGDIESDNLENFKIPKTIILALNSPNAILTTKDNEDINIKNINGKFLLNINNTDAYNTYSLVLHSIDLNFAGSKVNIIGNVNKYDENKPSVVNAQILFGNTPIKSFFDKLPIGLIGKNTAEWLSNHVRGGYLGLSQIIWRGDLDDSFPYDAVHDQTKGVFNLKANLVNTTIDYAPGIWPAIEHLNASLILRGRALELKSHNATINGSVISSLNADIKNLGSSDNKNLIITSKIKTSGLELHNVIATTPLKQNLMGVNDYTQFKGPIKLDLGLKIPLSNEDSTEVNGKLQFMNNSLAVYNTPFKFESLNGKIDFTSNTVNAENLVALFNNNQAFLSINNNNDSKGTKIELDSLLDFKYLLDYYKLPLDKVIYGSSVFNLVLNISRNDLENKKELQVYAESDLVGVQADLPGIFSKQISDVKKLQFDMEYDFKDYYKYTLAVPNNEQVTSLELNEYQHNYQFSVDSMALKGQLLFGVNKDVINAKFYYLNLDQILNGNTPRSLSIDYFSLPNIKTEVLNLVYNNTNIENVNLNISSDNKNRIFYLKDFSIDNSLFRLKMSGEHVAGGRIPHDSMINQLTDIQNMYIHTSHLIGEYNIKDSRKTIKLLNKSDFKNQMNINGNFDLQWDGELFNPYLNDIKGNISITSGKGIISDIEPGVGRIFSFFNLEILSKRLLLDFSDVFEQGYIFDSVRGKFNLEKGVLSTNRAIIQAGSADIDLYGSIDLKNRQYNLKADVTPHITTGLPIAAAVIGTPVAGAAVFIIDKLLDSPMDQLTERSYSINGTWVDPKIKKLKFKRGPLIEVSWLNPIVDEEQVSDPILDSTFNFTSTSPSDG